MHSSPNESTISNGVNQPVTVVLYDQSGRALSVNEEDRAHFLGLGFRLSKFDIADAASELKALFAAAADAVEAYIDGVVGDGVIDTSDAAAAATAGQAMREVEVAWFNLQNAINAKYPVTQAEPTTLLEEVAIVDGNVMSLTELGARKVFEQDYEKAHAITYETRERQIDPGQVAYYLDIPGWSKA